MVKVNPRIQDFGKGRVGSAGNCLLLKRTCAQHFSSLFEVWGYHKGGGGGGSDPQDPLDMPSEGQGVVGQNPFPVPRKVCSQLQASVMRAFLIKVGVPCKM